MKGLCILVSSRYSQTMLLSEPIFCKSFCCYGIEIRVQSYAGLDWLEKDFSYFLAPTPALAEATLTLRILPLAQAKAPLSKVTQIFSECNVHEIDEQRWLDYKGQAWLCQETEDCALLYVDQQDLAQELCYLFLQSRLGFHWDKRNHHRVHAIGFILKEQTILALAPSGGGKSTLALALLQNEFCQLLGDDQVLINSQGQVLPLAFRLAFGESAALGSLREKTQLWQRRKFGPKRLLAWGDCPHPAATPQARDCAKILLLQKTTAAPSLLPCSRLRALPLLFSQMVIGIGLPQVRELLLTGELTRYGELLWIALKRSLAACKLLSSARCYLFRTSSDLSANQQCLLQLLRESAKIPE